jgi:Zn-dependent protease with chaperone function
MTLALAPVAQAQLGSNEDPYGVGQVEESLDGRLGGGDVNFIDSVVGIINILLGLLGLIAVIIILMGGFKWMTAGGNDEKVTEARKLIFSGIIGLAIILSAWAIARFVIDSLQSATGAGLNTGGSL